MEELMIVTELWLEDFEESSRDCDWSETQWALWFSWFITSPAKTTWHRKLSSMEKMSWKIVKKIYQGQYCVNLDP